MCAGHTRQVAALAWTAWTCIAVPASRFDQVLLFMSDCILTQRVCAGQEREQVEGRRQEVVDTKERIVETTVPDPCGGVPTSQYQHGYTGSGSSGVTGAGSYGTHNTGSTGENVKSYVPGTDANREARYEQGRGTGSGSTGTGYTGTGGGYGAGSGASGTGSGAGGARTIT